MSTPDKGCYSNSRPVDDLLVLNAVRNEADDWYWDWAKGVTAAWHLEHLAPGETPNSRHGQIIASLRRLRARGLVERVRGSGHTFYRITDAGEEELALFDGDLPGPSCRRCWRREAIDVEVPEAPHLFVGMGLGPLRYCADCHVERAGDAIRQAQDSVAREAKKLEAFRAWSDWVCDVVAGVSA